MYDKVKVFSIRRLTCTFDLKHSFDPNTAFTRTNYGAPNSGTLLDYIFISDELKHSTSNIVISHYSDNFSDHLPVTVDIELSISSDNDRQKDCFPASINWANLCDDKKQQYEDCMSVNLAAIDIPFNSLLHGNHCCNSNEHIFCLEKYFCDIVDAIDNADKILPRSRPGVSRDFWNSDLTDLKAASFDAFTLWRDSGRPSSGPIYELKKNTGSRFKLAVRKAKKEFNQEQCNTIHENLVTDGNVKFWRSWQNLHGKKQEGGRINGKIEDQDIANEFATNFRKIYDEANSDQAKLLSDSFDSLFRLYSNTHENDYLGPSYLSWANMVTIMSKLKAGKASGSSIKAEHILNGCPQLTIHLHLLFNSMIQHGYVPSDFLRGVITPIIKDAEGDISSIDNYRGITLSHVFSYLFEHAVLLKIDSFLLSDDLQFGYKKNHSTSHAIYSVKRCIEYFCDHGSNVYASFLDCTKGFDRVCHKGLFLKLMQRKVPFCWIRILLYWYSNLYSICKWRNAYSSPFLVISGVRQGGVLSAKFWSVYMDDLIKKIRAKKLGCHIVDLFIACIFYADDVCLLAPTRHAMQVLLDTCSEYASLWCIKYNEKKTKVMFFGKGFKSVSCAPLFLNGRAINFEPEWKYLGVVIVTGNGFSCSARRPLAAFYRSSNSVLNVLKGPSEHVLMKLLYDVCVPNLTYACEVTDFLCVDKTPLHVAVNDAIRRIFSYNRWESIRKLRKAAGYLCLTEIYAKRKMIFEQRLSKVGNSFLTKLSQITLDVVS